MKNLLKFLPIALIAVSFASCKKDYTCTCTNSGGDPIVTTYENVKKSTAQTACDLLDTAAFITGENCTLD